MTAVIHRLRRAVERPDSSIPWQVILEESEAREIVALVDRLVVMAHNQVVAHTNPERSR